MNFGFYSSYVALWIWVIFQGLLTLAIFRQVLELEKLGAKWQGSLGGESLLGSRAPKFSGTDIRSGQPINVNVFNGQGGVILFLTAHCSVCRHVSKNLQDDVLESLPPVLAICTGDAKSAMKLGKRLAPQIPLLVDGADVAASAFKVSAFPTAVVLDAERKVQAYGGISNVEDIERLIGRTTGGEIQNKEPAMAAAASGHSA